MSGLGGHVRALATRGRSWAVDEILAHQVRVRYPTMTCHHTVRWDYGRRDLDAIELGERVFFGPHAEVLVHRRNRNTSVEGRLVIGDDAVITTGVDIRAAGGRIEIGDRSGVGQYSVLVAANHSIERGRPHIHSPWDETRTGVFIDHDVWIGALCVVLPGARIGHGAVIAAGSVVGGEVPPEEVWGGVPARKIKDVPEGGPGGVRPS